MFLQASTEFASAGFGSQIEYLRHSFTGRFYVPLGSQHGTAGLGLRPQDEHQHRAHHQPELAGCSHLRPLLPRRYPRRAWLPAAHHRPRLPLNQSLDVNAPPIANGADIGGNLQAYMNLELEFPIIDKVGIRGVIFYDMGNAWNTERTSSARPRRRPQFDRVINPLLQRQQPHLPAHQRRLRCPLVLSARAAPLRVGLPPRAAPLRRSLGLRVHHRQLLLTTKSAKRGRIRRKLSAQEC